MPELIVVEHERGSVLFETELSDAALEQIGVIDRLDEVVGSASVAAGSIGEAVRVVVGSVQAGFTGLATDKAAGGNLGAVEVEFGLKVSGEGSMYVAKAGAEANLSVTVKWDFTGDRG